MLIDDMLVEELTNSILTDYRGDILIQSIEYLEEEDSYEILIDYTGNKLIQ